MEKIQLALFLGDQENTVLASIWKLFILQRNQERKLYFQTSLYVTQST